MPKGHVPVKSGCVTRTTTCGMCGKTFSGSIKKVNMLSKLHHKYFHKDVEIVSQLHTYKGYDGPNGNRSFETTKNISKYHSDHLSKINPAFIKTLG